MRPFIEKLTHIQTDDIHDVISKEYFNKHYGFCGIPVKFSKTFQNCITKDRWTIDYLIESLPREEVLKGSYLFNADTVATIRDYVSNSERYTNMYYQVTDLSASRLCREYETPGIFNCWYANNLKHANSGSNNAKLSNLFVGNKETVRDITLNIWNTSSWNYLVSGKIMWLIYPSVYYNLIKSNIENYSIRQAIELPEKFFRQQIMPLVSVQNSGEVLFVPSGFHCAIYNIDNSVLLTENFINETNYDNVRSYFRKEGNKSNISYMENIVKEGFEGIDNFELPIPYRSHS